MSAAGEPRPTWESRARGLFWAMLGLNAVFVITEELAAVEGDTLWITLRMIVAVAWSAAGLVWLFAVVRRRRTVDRA